MSRTDETDSLIRRIMDKVDDDCFEFGNNIDGCKVKASRFSHKVRFDECANEYFGVEGGCDCIFIFPDKVCIVECTTGKFGSEDAERKPKQIRECYRVIRSLGYRGLITAVFYYGSINKISKERAEIELKDLKKKDRGFIIKFLKCGKDSIG